MKERARTRRPPVEGSPLALSISRRKLHTGTGPREADMSIKYKEGMFESRLHIRDATSRPQNWRTVCPHYPSRKLKFRHADGLRENAV